MTDFYVDTTAPVDGDGLSWETAWNALRPHFTSAGLGAGDHIINCRGGVDEGPAFGEGDFPAHFMACGGAVVGPAQEGVVLRLGDGQG